MGNSSYDRMIKEFIRYGDRQSSYASKLAEQKREIEEELRKMEKSDARENFSYNEQVDKLKSVCFKVSKYKYWEQYYNKFKKKLLETSSYNKPESSGIIDIGSIVKYTVNNRHIVALIVPMHLSNRKIFAVGIDTPAGAALQGHRAGDTVTIESRNLEIHIEEVL